MGIADMSKSNWAITKPAPFHALFLLSLAWLFCFVCLKWTEMKWSELQPLPFHAGDLEGELSVTVPVSQFVTAATQPFSSKY